MKVRWRLSRLAIASIAFLTTACTPQAVDSPAEVESPKRTAVVERVVDGDTVKVSIGGRRETVRLIGVDTPETVARNRPVGCYGAEASNYTKQRLPKGTEVSLVLDVEARDRYDRLLAYVYRADNNAFINAELAAEGYANVLTIPPNVAHADEFVRLVAQARSENKGLWGTCPVKP